MYKNKKIIAVIPARSGSKRVPLKNIKSIAGKPLIAWTLDAAKKSKYIDNITVSTDSSKIANIVRKLGVKVPFLRPEKLAQDNVPSIDVVIHAISFHKNNGVIFDMVVLLHPTCPLRTSADIDQAIELFFKKMAKAVISITEAFKPPLWMNTLPANQSMKNFISKKVRRLSTQKLPQYFQLNGAIFIGTIDYIKKNNGFFGNKTFAFIMPKERSIDIDEILDFKLAEVLLKEHKNA